MISVLLEIAIVLSAALLVVAIALLRGVRRPPVRESAPPVSPNVPLERIGAYHPETIAVRYGGGRGPHHTHLN